MITEKALKKAKVLAFWEKHGLEATIEDKASHLLYLIIKDHPFSDGNKRSVFRLMI